MPQVKVSNQTKLILDKLKVHERVPYDEVINDLAIREVISRNNGCMPDYLNGCK
jgi:hypothetical protein